MHIVLRLEVYTSCVVIVPVMNNCPSLPIITIVLLVTKKEKAYLPIRLCGNLTEFLCV